jgi:hypothetical protein
MRVFVLRSTLCLATITFVASLSFAGVRGKPANLKPLPAGQQVAQSDANNTVNSVPVPADVRVTGETVLQESTVAPATSLGKYHANCVPVAPSTSAPSAQYVAVPVMMLPMPLMTPMPMMTPVLNHAPSAMPLNGAYGYGAAGRGLSPAAAAAYEQAFGPGLYRTGAEVGQYHFPYYSYRRPWYFPGQPSFHRSTDYVW